MNDGPGIIDDLMLRRAVMSASMAMAVTDPHRPDNPIVFTNPAFSQLTGYAASRIVGRNCRFLQGADTDPVTVATIRQALADRKDLQIDILNYRSDGSRFVNRLFVSPVLNGKGELVHFFASQLDASDLIRQDAINRRREDVLRYLAGDLSQRLGSTMQVVQTLVGSTLASASSVLEAGEAISARLIALGQVHRRISDHDWEGEEFASLVHQTIEPFRPQFSGLHIEGPRVHLGALLSLRMASAIYELSRHATARKSGVARSLWITWTLAGDRDTPRLQFTWHEQGATHTTCDERTKLQRAVSALMNDRQVEVSVRVDHDAGGLACRIAAPIPELAEAQIPRAGSPRPSR